MKKENKMNLLDLMETARNYYGCLFVKIISDKKVEGTDIQEIIYFDRIEHAISSVNQALMLLNYLDYDSYTIENIMTLIVFCKVRKVGE